jgi:hypothetical protein
LGTSKLELYLHNYFVLRHKLLLGSAAHTDPKIVVRIFISQWVLVFEAIAIAGVITKHWGQAYTQYRTQGPCSFNTTFFSFSREGLLKELDRGRLKTIAIEDPYSNCAACTRHIFNPF